MTHVELIEDEAEDYTTDTYGSIDQNLRSYSGFLSLLKELIQNSDDSYDGGKGVEIGVYFLKNKLKLTNNTIFKENDWDKIKIIGSRNKNEDSIKTGRFGIGFTSVFKICDCLDVHSNNKSKRLDLNNLKWKLHKESRIVGNNTEFEFFWRFEETEVCKKINADIILPEQIKTEFIPDTLKYIHEEMHFLKNVTQIVIYEDEKLLQTISIEKKCEDINQKILKETNTITTINGASDIKNSIRLIYHKNLEHDFFEEYQTGVARRKPLLLSIAINVSELQDGHIYCTLPTEEPTKLKFDINCDFQPDPSRKRLILNLDDQKGAYNLKLLSFIPELLYEILDDLKNNITPQRFYEIISGASDTFNDDAIYSDNDFVSKIKNNNCEIICINNKWHTISDSYIIAKSPILSFLKRIDYSIISEKFLKFEHFFKLIGVTQFEIQDLIRLIKDYIPEQVSFVDSIFESNDELKSVFEYLLINPDYEDYISKICELNIFLTVGGDLKNTSQTKIYNVPSSLKLIKNNLDIDTIDEVIFNEFDDLLLMLGVQKFSRMDLIEMMYNDFHHQIYPMNLLQSKSYINSKDKIRKIISFISSDLEKYQKYKDNLLNRDTDEYNKLKKCDYLPLIVDDKDQLYPLKDSIYIFDLDSDLKKRFALKYDILDVTVVHDIAYLLPDYNLSKSLTLDLIFAKVQEYIESVRPLEEDDLILLYELILEGEFQLKQSNIKNIIETIPIFINDDCEFCSLVNNGKKMKLLGGYTSPIKIKEILDEKLIKNISGFKENILKRYFVEELTFEIYIKEYFQDVFDSESVDTGQKLQLIKELNEQFLRIENDLDIIEVLKNTKFVYCQDNQFHHINENNLFFKSDEIKKFFGNDYLYPNFHEIDKYEHLLKKIGLKEELKPFQIVNYIIGLTENAKINAHLIYKFKNVFTYINNHWSNFEDTNEFKKLSDIEWLPAVNDDFRLYKPSNPNFYTPDTEPFLCMYEDIVYLDSNETKNIRQGFVDVLQLKNIPQISTQMICLNLKYASGEQKHIDQSTKIYIELSRRLKDNRYVQDKHFISELKSFPSIYKKYKGENTPHYFKPTEIFVNDCHKKYGREYIDYLEQILVEKCDGFIKFLGILEEPDRDTLRFILEQIDSKYKNNGYLISKDDDKEILDNCLEQLNKSIKNFDSEFISKLKRIHIFCNSDDKLITSKEAIINDRPSLYNEFKDQLGDYFINYQNEKIDLINILDIDRLSQVIKKELKVEPDSNQLEIDKNLTKKLRFLSKLMPRIKAEKTDLDESKWSYINFDIIVSIFDELCVTRYVKLVDTPYYSNNINIQCYAKKIDNEFVEMYIKNSEDVMNSIVQEIFEEIHPELSTDFKSVIYSLLEKESYPDMEKMLTDLDYPVLGNKEKHVRNILDDDKEFESESGIDDFESNLDIEPSLDDSGGKTTQKDNALHRDPINKSTSQNDVSDIESSSDDGGTISKNECYEDQLKQMVSPDAATKKSDGEITYSDITNDNRSDDDKNTQNEHDIMAAIRETEDNNQITYYQKKKPSSTILPEVRQRLIQDYDGKCQICFEKILNNIEEPHMRMRRLVFPHKSNLGISDESNMLALCPNCWAKLQKNFPWSFINEGRVSDTPDFVNVDHIEKNDRDYVCIKIIIAGEDKCIHYKQSHFDKFKYLYENY